MKYVMPVWRNLVPAGAVAVVALIALGCSRTETGQTTPYPLKTCLVSDEPLDGDMGKAYVFAHEGHEIKLCCKSCLKDFNQDPAKYLKKLELAASGGDQKETAGSRAGNHGDHPQ